MLRNLIIAGLLLTFASASLRAQDYLRERGWYRSELSVENHAQYPELRLNSGTLVITPGSTSGPALARAWTPAGALDASVTLPFRWVGTAQEILPGEFLVCGTAFPTTGSLARNAVLCRLHAGRTAQGVLTLSLIETSVVGNFDPAWLDFNEQEGRLYVADHDTGIFHSAIWNVAQLLPQSLTLHPPGTQLASLMAYRSGWALGARSDYGRHSTRMGSAGTLLLSGIDSTAWHVHIDPTTTFAEVVAVTQAIPHLAITQPWLIGGSEPFTVTARNVAAQLSVQLVENDTQTVVGTFSLAPNQPTSVGPFAHLNDRPGRDYELVVSANPSLSQAIQGNVRIGSPLTPSSGLALGRGLLPNWGGIAPGTTDVSAFASTSGTGLAYCALNMAFRQFNANGTYTDPIVNGVLQPQGSISFWVEEGRPRASVSAPLVVPDDPGLHGSVILFQYIALSSNEQVSGSDIFGCRLDTIDAEASSLSAQSASSSQTQAGSSTPPIPSLLQQFAQGALISGSSGPPNMMLVNRLVQAIQ
jgi:hypothetical protein